MSDRLGQLTTDLFTELKTNYDYRDRETSRVPTFLHAHGLVHDQSGIELEDSVISNIRVLVRLAIPAPIKKPKGFKVCTLGGLPFICNKAEWTFASQMEMEAVQACIIEATRKGVKRLTQQPVRLYSFCPNPVDLIPRAFRLAVHKRSA